MAASSCWASLNRDARCRTKKNRRGRRAIRALTALNLLLTGCLLILLFIVSERWWPGVIATYAPRFPALVLSLLLLPFSWFVDRISAGVNALVLALAAIVIMEFNIPKGADDQPGRATPIRVASYNVRNFAPNAELQFKEIFASGADVVVLQEAWEKPGTLATAFSGWNSASATELWVSSRFPVRLIDRYRPVEGGRDVAAAFEIDHPDGAFIVVNVHPATAQFGIRQLDPRNRGKQIKGPTGMVAADGLDGLRRSQAYREAELEMIRQLIERVGNDRPTIVAGDFNAPASSHLFQGIKGGFRDVFEQTCWGYGYTAPLDGPGLAALGIPWIRVDHILVDDRWAALGCSPGTGGGSDHRLLSAELCLRKP